jgi:hypothetical protein
MSHEAIRQLVLEAPVSLHHPVSKRHGRVLFVEAEGLCFPPGERKTGERGENLGGSRGMETKWLAA